MPATLIVRDESNTGDVTNQITLEFPTESITVRELIRERVYQEVQDYNRRLDGDFRGLVQPSDANPTPKGSRLKPGRPVEWKVQFEKAVEAFERRRVLILIDTHQVERLDETVELKRGTEVTFMKLLPLVGG